MTGCNSRHRISPEGRHDFERVLVFVLALLLFATSGCAAAEGVESPPGIQVLHYDLELDVDTRSMEIQGVAELTIVRTGEDVARLHLRGPSVLDVLVNGRSARHTTRRGILEITFDVPDDTVRVQVEYEGAPDEGLYRGVVSGRDVVYTDGWPMRVAGWLPGTHHPSSPSTLDMRIRSSSGTIAASGKIVAETEDALRVLLDHPAPTYTFAFAIADFDTSSTGLHRHYHFGNDRGLARSEDVLAVTGEIIGEYPYASFSTVAVPFGYAGMENATAAFLNADLYSRPSELEQVLIHEVVHQWFGNSLTIADWTDLWISEGVTTYLSSVVYERLDGIDAAREARTEMARLDPSLARRAPAVVPPHISDPAEMLSWVVYRKAGTMLHALRLLIGDEAFFEALRSMYGERPPGGLSTDRAIDSFHETAQRDLTNFFEFWLKGRTFPRLTLEWDRATEVLSWAVSADEGTLENVDFEIEIMSGGESWYVNRSAASVRLADVTERPTVRPVGVMLDIRWKN